MKAVPIGRLQGTGHDPQRRGARQPPTLGEIILSEADMVKLVERFLRRYAPPRDPAAEDVADIVAEIATTPDLTRVDDLAGRRATSVRRLQRLFAEYVGVGPKW